MPAELENTLDLREVSEAIGDIERRGKLLRPAFAELRKPMRLDQRTHARAQAGPDGGWQPRSPFTEARRLARNRAARVTKAMRVIAPSKLTRRSTPKRVLGRLPAAIAVTVGQLYVRATSRVRWAGAHQVGARVGWHRAVRLPRRTFLWLSEQLVETTREVLGRYIVGGWKR